MTYVKRLLIVLMFILLASNLMAQVNFRVMTYNGLKLDGEDGDRQAAFQTVLEAANPDVLLMQEIVDAEGADLILNALNAGGTQYARTPFINGTDTDNMFFYRTSVVTFNSQFNITTALREITEYVATIGGNQILFYGCHLKASSGSADEQKRFYEVNQLRNHLRDLPAGTEWIIVGDMNIYYSGEPAYQKFIETGIGQSEDLLPPGLVGSWHNNPIFASVHTQSPRTTQFGGGARGGLDDRFDMILANFGLNDGSGIEYVDNSITVFGNDDNHFNQAVNSGTNSVVSQQVADALRNASDHLPVYADFTSLGDGGGNIPP